MVLKTQDTSESRPAQIKKIQVQKRKKEKGKIKIKIKIGRERPGAGSYEAIVAALGGFWPSLKTPEMKNHLSFVRAVTARAGDSLVL